MTGKQKILSVLKDIKSDSEINPSPEWIKFRFNTSVIGSGILNDDEEKRILLKLQREKVIEIHFLDEYGDQQNIDWSQIVVVEILMKSDSVWIKILPPFWRKYFWYNLTAFGQNKWNIVNPLWLFFQLLKSIIYIIKWLWNKSKIITVFLGIVSGALVYDWSLAWINIKKILVFFKIQ